MRKRGWPQIRGRAFFSVWCEPYVLTGWRRPCPMNDLRDERDASPPFALDNGKDECPVLRRRVDRLPLLRGECVGGVLRNRQVVVFCAGKSA